MTKIEKLNNSPNSITQDNFSYKTQWTGSIFPLKQTQKCKIAQSARKPEVFSGFSLNFFNILLCLWEKNSRNFTKTQGFLMKKLSKPVVGCYTLIPKKRSVKKPGLRYSFFLAKSRSNRHQLIKYNDKAIGTKSRYEIFQIRNWNVTDAEIFPSSQLHQMSRFDVNVFIYCMASHVYYGVLSQLLN